MDQRIPLFLRTFFTLMVHLLTGDHNPLLLVQECSTLHPAGLLQKCFCELRNASGSVMTLLGEADATLCNDKHSVISTSLIAAHINHALSLIHI